MSRTVRAPPPGRIIVSENRGDVRHVYARRRPGDLYAKKRKRVHETVSDNEKRAVIVTKYFRLKKKIEARFPEVGPGVEFPRSKRHYYKPGGGKPKNTHTHTGGGDDK